MQDRQRVQKLIAADSKKHESSLPQLGLDLLKRSHALNEQMSDENRAGLLNTQIFTANRFDTKLGTAWAHELFDLGAKRQVRNPSFIEVLAINSIASSDPDGALELLARVDPAAIAFRDENDMQGATFAVRMPQTLLTALVRKYGKKTFPKVLETAELLGGEGRYPVERFG